MTVLDAGLHDVLKALKLTGMLDTLDERLAQARAGQLGHTEILQLLCEDELARRQSAAMARRLTRARFEAGQATLEAFDFTTKAKLPTAAIRDLAALRWLAAGESVILYGPVGVGKTPRTSVGPQRYSTGCASSCARRCRRQPSRCSAFRGGLNGGQRGPRVAGRHASIGRRIRHKLLSGHARGSKASAPAG